MKNYLHTISYYVLISFFIGVCGVNAQTSAVYGGGSFYSGGQSVMNDLRSSGFNTVILWTIHVSNQGNMNFNDIPVIDTNGNYIGDPNWSTRIASLKQAPTSVNRVELGIASAGATDFENIETLINTNGTGSNTALYKAFQNLKTVTKADAVNFDDESNYDVDTMVKFAVMLADIGYKVTLVPYTRKSFWATVYNQVEAQRPGTIDKVYLQVYAGGSGNNPASWNGSFGNLKVIPGLWSVNGAGCNRGDTPSQVETRMRGWKNDISGGFMWLYDDIEKCTAPGRRTADYANAINIALESSAGGATNLAPNAAISVSSEYTNPNWSKEKLTDGIIGQNGNGEWASNGEQTPWAQLNWNTPITTNKVILFDRPSPAETINAGRLTFSDGSSINVSALPDNGTAKELAFPARTISWVRFTVTNGSGPNNGLSEFQVFEADGGGPTAPIQTPFGGTPWTIPGVVESEDFDNGGQGIAYNDSNPNSNTGGRYRTNEGVDIAVANEGGHQIGWTVLGEWQEYTVNVATAGTYNAAIRYAANAGVTGAVRIEVNGADLTGSVNLPVTGGWQTFQTVNTELNLNVGEQVIRIVTVTAGINLNKITFTQGGTPAPIAVTLGNALTTNGFEDMWRSNMFVNESDTYTNNSGSSQQIKITEFNFYAYRKADPVTPFVVKVNSNNNFTVLAVGTTRNNTSYNQGENNFAFNDGTAVTITINDGDTIATGYLDANANGSGGNIGSVIPFDQSAGADELWYTGGPNSNQAGSVSVGSAPTAGNQILNLNRNYRYNFKMEVINNNRNARNHISLGSKLNNVETYPNPFKNELKIKYQLKQTSRVEIAIYDIQGRLVNSLINESQHIGSHTFQWNAINAQGNTVSNGIYIIELKLPEETYYKRVVFVSK